MLWHVVSVNARMELDVAARINNGGFVAHCPTYIKKCGHHRRGRHFFHTRVEPLFSGYIFVRADGVFCKDEFETSKVRLTVFRKILLLDDHITLFNRVALAMTAADGDIEKYRARNAPKPKPITKGDVMKILHGAMQGEPVDVLEVRREAIKVVLKRFAGAAPVTINAGSLGRAV